MIEFWVLDKDKKLIDEISSSEILKMIEDNIITEGMIPKINTCLDAVNNGVTAVGIIDGRKQHSILFEIFSDKGSGTLIRKWKILKKWNIFCWILMEFVMVNTITTL